jgi:hypothetical protein
MINIPASYQDSRQYFRECLSALRELWPNARLDKQSLTAAQDLSIDWLRAEALQHREKLLIITTGLHGIEGYIGSAILQLFVDEFLPRLKPDSTGILLIHSLNPWGMSQWKRINPNNVDLNRNFISGDLSSAELVNNDYKSLLTFLCPGRPVGGLLTEKWVFISGLVRTVIRLGTQRLREAALMGQYEYPSGIYFGGQSIQEETRIMMQLYQDSFMGYKRIIHLDLHSGYGPRDQMTVVTSPMDNRSALEIKQQYQLARVAGANPEEFYSMHGDMNDWEYELVRTKIPGSSIFAANFEFGTYGRKFLSEARSLRITILKNQKNLYGGSAATGEWIDREYRELYLPNDPAWFEKARQDARQAFNGIFNSEGITISS